jgi:hypothetical protein
LPVHNTHNFKNIIIDVVDVKGCIVLLLLKSARFLKKKIVRLFFPEMPRSLSFGESEKKLLSENKATCKKSDKRGKKNTSVDRQVLKKEATIPNS